jgi:hypothetical protein
MSDKSVPITIQGSYRGYAISVQIDSTLDSLDRLVERLQARGVEPMPTAPAPGAAAPSASAGNGKSERPLETLEGTVGSHITGEHARQPAAKVAIITDAGEKMVDFWKDFPGDLVSLPKGTRVRVYGHSRTKVNTFGKEYQNFSVSRWEAVE